MKIKNLFSIICLVIFLFFSNQTWAGNWVLYLKSDMGDKYYDKSSIKKVDKSIVRVWTKTILNETGKRERISFLKKIGEAPGEPDIIDYNLMLEEIDCVNEKHRASSIITYDKGGSIIASSPGNIGRWNDIVPGSISETLKNIICTACKILKTKNK